MTPVPEREQSAMARVAQLGGAELVGQLVALYTEQMRERIGAAQSAARDGDTDTLAALAHAMKSSSAQLGATDLAATCESMETAAERGDRSEASAQLEVIQRQFDAVAGQLVSEVAAHAESVGSPHDSAARRAGDSRRSDSRIAVIEDNADNRLLIDAILGDRFALDEYENGHSALAGMRQRAPDLVLLDVSLPGMDGLDVLRRMREDDALRRVPVVAVTAHAMDGDRERYLNAGFDEYVPKPIDDAMLVSIVEDLLDHSAPRAGRR
jgi:CheY-like chemotaxis protein